ncbi:Alpha/Beta hydrolase protein [Aspergillus caelatus]|uniref:Kynurenine formamidase n=1 Tax=Aspergillus caelatus TaxID=61420 RepID=A0A5N7A7E1_9EURO|nr:Alpha/Beta hydrolase protein [Aspergillus caelatus]KAE8364460.1 Alpha/Beta hydrolase protein [Aspergillus caelatus]
MPTETFSYGEDHALQTVTVTTLSEALDKKYWIILIHGGAWRDPNIDAINFSNPAISTLTTSPAYAHVLPHITAFASISYRLSPHPSHPQDQSSISPREYRSAKHPDHINDVQAAIAFLQRKYGFEERYILVGHSCGATLAFQSVMGRFKAGISHGPLAVVGLAGIYGLRLFRDTHKEISAYQEIVEGAFGDDEAAWDAVSPAVAKGADGVEGGWTEGRWAILAYSPEDSLVDASQREAMDDTLKGWWALQSEDKLRCAALMPLGGEHDECWEKGEGLAEAIGYAIEKQLEIAP